MFSHVMVGSNDLDRSRRFYDATLGTLGVRPGRVDPKGRVIYAHAGGLFMVTTPLDGAPATHANGGTIGFAAADPAAVDAWHRAGTESSGTETEGAPDQAAAMGIRLYRAYLRDPDGNKLAAIHRMAPET